MQRTKSTIILVYKVKLAPRVEDIQDSSHVLTDVNLRSVKAKVQSTSLTWDLECLDVSILCVSPLSLCHPD